MFQQVIENLTRLTLLHRSPITQRFKAMLRFCINPHSRPGQRWQQRRHFFQPALAVGRIEQHQIERQA